MEVSTRRVRVRALQAPLTAAQLTNAMQDASDADETEVEVAQTQIFEVATAATAAELQVAAGEVVCGSSPPPDTCAIAVAGSSPFVVTATETLVGADPIPKTTADLSGKLTNVLGQDSTASQPRYHLIVTTTETTFAEPGVDLDTQASAQAGNTTTVLTGALAE